MQEIAIKEAFLNNMKDIDLTLIKNQLRGANFKRLLKSKKVKKYGIAKDCGITYRTLCNWQTGKTEPSDYLAMIVARYLGLIKPKEADILGIKKKQDELQKEIDRLSK